jgi:hypothetical protein
MSQTRYPEEYCNYDFYAQILLDPRHTKAHEHYKNFFRDIDMVNENEYDHSFLILSLAGKAIDYEEQIKYMSRDAKEELEQALKEKTKSRKEKKYLSYQRSMYNKKRYEDLYDEIETYLLYKFKYVL